MIADPISPPERILALREAMVDRLKRDRSWDSRTEAAFRKVPRHLFLPGIEIDKVYSGDVIPTRYDENKRAISSSSEVAIMAVMADQLELAAGMRVLEVGAGTGYNAAILCELVGATGSVTTVDIDPEIASEARERLDAAGYGSVRVVTGDGWEGVADGAPYDRIELTASTSDLSPQWVDQLAEGGILLVPLWLRAGWMVLAAFRKQDGTLRTVSVRGGGFMPLRGPNAPVDPGVARGDHRVVGARAEDLDAIFGHLAADPDIVLGPSYRQNLWDRMTALAAFGADLIGLRGLGIGLYDARSGGLAVALFASLGYLGPRVVYAVYGERRALERLRALVEEGPQGLDEIEIEAQPLITPVTEGGITRRHYRPIVRRIGSRRGGPA